MKKIIYLLSRKLFLGILFIALFTSFCNAATEIQMDISDDNFDISKLVELQINISSDASEEGGEIIIPGLESFHVVSKSQNNSESSINGDTRNSVGIILTLKAKTAGKYEIGPIIFGDISSNSVNLEVTGAEVFIGGQIDSLPPSGSNELSQEQEAELEKLQEALEQEILQKIGNTGNTDGFMDIMPNTSQSPFYLKNSILFFLFIVLLYIGSLLYKKLQHHLEERREEIVPEIPKIQTDFLSLLNTIEEHDLEVSKEIFYGKLGKVIRQYLDEKIEEGLSTKTFGELKKRIKSFPSLKRVYEKVYFPEYNTQEDTKQQRIELIHNLKDELI